MIDTGVTLTLAAKTLKDKGAKSVHALISHGMYLGRYPITLHIHFPLAGLLSELNLAAIDQLPIEQLVVTNTIPQTLHKQQCSKLVTIDVSATIAESIRRTHNGESISLLFGEWAETGTIAVL